MTDIKELTAEQKEFLAPALPTSALEREVDKPFVTLTYAQSLDSMVALRPGMRTTLSGPESKSMTHYLRSHHAGILIGSGTAQADDPSLNCRYPGATLETQPRPILVGSNLPPDWITECKATALANEGQAKHPWTVSANGEVDDPELFHSHRWRGNSLQYYAYTNERIDWDAMIKELYMSGMDSIMIEGGATVINELIHKPALVDAVVVTVAPVYLGRDGVQVCPRATARRGEPIKAGTMRDVAWCQFGQDIVLRGKLEEIKWW